MLKQKYASNKVQNPVQFRKKNEKAKKLTSCNKITNFSNKAVNNWELS